MIAEPRFWRGRGVADRLAAAALAPAALVYDAGQRLRAAAVRRRRAQAPAICVGAATLGGVGKTPFALEIAAILAPDAAGAVAFVTRGYGGREAGPHRVAPGVDDATRVGDEALLLAAAGPVFVARDRAAGIAAAAEAGAALVVLDDGFQNPAAPRDVCVLLVDAADPTGNGRVFPAGPLREPLGRAAARADVIVIVGDGEPPRLPALTPRWRARPVFGPAPAGPLLAFCGIGRPERFFLALRSAGGEVVEARAYPDHHAFSAADLAEIGAAAARAGATPICTRKDWVRLPPGFRDKARVLDMTLRIDDPQAAKADLQRLLDARRPEWRR